MIRQFFKDGLTYGVANLLTRSISFLLVPLYTRALHPDEFGAVDLVLLLAVLVNLTVPLEISQGFARLYPESKSDRERAAFSSTALIFTLCAYAGACLLLLAVGEPLTRWLLGSTRWLATFQAGVAFFMANGIFLILQHRLRWGLQPKEYCACGFLFAVVTAAVSVFLVLWLRLGATGVILGQLAGALVASALSWYWSRKHYRILFSLQKCREMLAFSIPLIPSSLNVFVSLYVDRLFIKEYLSLEALGVYGVAYRFASVATLLTVGFNSALTPLIYTHHGDPSTRRDIARLFRYFIAMALVFMVALSAFAREVVVLFTTPHFYEAWRVIPVIALSMIFSSMYVFLPGMDIFKKTRRITGINLAAAVTNLLLNLCLVPSFGIMGAAVATLGSGMLMFFLYCLFSQRLYRVPHQWPRMGCAAGLAGISVLVSYAPRDLFSLSPVSFLCLKGGVALGASVTVALLLLDRTPLPAAETFSADGEIPCSREGLDGRKE